MDKKEIEDAKDKASAALDKLGDGAIEMADDIDKMTDCMKEADTFLANADESNWKTAIEDARKKLSEYV